MSQFRRAYIPGGTYFFTVVTYQRAAIFNSEPRIEILRNALKKVQVTRPFCIEAMVILPDHLHCMMRLPENDANYSSRWREIKKAVSREIYPVSNVRNERLVWQRRFWEHLIRNEDDWRKHMDYIHYNPVKHRLVKSPGDWPWSSFNKLVEKGFYDVNWGAEEPVGLSNMNCE